MQMGIYECVRAIGRGGMGEVFLAYDPVCERHVALKRIREDLKNREVLRSRFLREAKITSQLTHPGIISIYAIYEEGDKVYYTMPYVEGKTLKALLKKKAAPSIRALLSIFKSICQTVAYAHARGILHRDLKPENILLGHFGEVLVFDWGLAESAQEEQVDMLSPLLTAQGKIVGTLAYMAPERALGQSATAQTDIYSLGVILYEMLALKLPFQRPSLKALRKNHEREKLNDPEEMAPHRDIPPPLSRIVKKCLAKSAEARYATVDDLLSDLAGYIEGRSEWFEVARLDCKKKKDWEFQEHLPLAKYGAITRSLEAEWVNIMLSKVAFAESIRLETRIRLEKEGSGIGFLLSVPEKGEREHPLCGYCLWLGTQDEKASQLFRGTIEVMRTEDLFLTKEKWHTLVIEKKGNNIQVSLDNATPFTYVSYLPLLGTHIGLMLRDDRFDMEPIIVSLGSHSLQVSCLAIADAFLACKDYTRSLCEYQRIASAFPGHSEGREAIFRSGITLLEQAKVARSDKKRDAFYSSALEEFSRLHRSAQAPFEYLGKSLVYQSQGDSQEEIKCLELALRRYRTHPHIAFIEDHILYRMHESSGKDRKVAYQLVLIALRHLSLRLESNHTVRLLRQLIAHYEVLPFFEGPLDPSLFGKEEDVLEKYSSRLLFEINLAFWVAHKGALEEIFEEALRDRPLNNKVIGNVIYALFELGDHTHLISQLIDNKDVDKDLVELLKPLMISDIENALSAFFALGCKDIGPREWRTLSYLLTAALNVTKTSLVHAAAEKLLPLPLGREECIALDGLRITAYLLEKNWTEAASIFESYSLELLNQETTCLHALYGCYLRATEGEEIARIHLSGVIDTPFPRSFALLGHQIANNILEKNWYDSSFLFERRTLYRQLSLYYHCSDDSTLSSYYHHLANKESLYSRIV